MFARDLAKYRTPHDRGGARVHLVIAGDIKIKLVDIELLTIQIRLLVCSVDKAKEMGIDWWSTNSYLSPNTALEPALVEELKARIAQLESAAKQSS